MIVTINATISRSLNTAMTCWAFLGSRSTRMGMLTMDLLRIAWLDARNANQAKSSRIRSSDQTHEMLKYRATAEKKVNSTMMISSALEQISSHRTMAR